MKHAEQNLTPFHALPVLVGDEIHSGGGQKWLEYEAFHRCVPFEDVCYLPRGCLQGGFVQILLFK